MFHPREWAECDISQLSWTPLATGGTRALQPRKGSQWKSLNDQPKRRSDDALAIKWLHWRQGRYEKTGGRRIKEEGKEEIFHYCSFIPSIFTRDGCMLSNAAESAGDREDMSTPKCIDFLQSGKLLENKSGWERGSWKTIWLGTVWQILQERMEKSLEEKDRMFFKESCKQGVCTLGACVC